MSAADVPWLKRMAGSAVGWVAYALCMAIMQLPDAALVRLLGGASTFVGAVSGASSAARAVADLHFMFRQSGPSAKVIRDLITRSRPEEIVSIIRGAVIRSL